MAATVVIIIFAGMALTLLLSAVLFLIAFYCPNRRDLTYRVMKGPDFVPYHDRMLEDTRRANAIPFERVETCAFDGIKLAAKLYIQDVNAPFHLMFHGYKGAGVRAFSHFLPLVLSMDENVLLVDQRAHGDSGGHIVTFGIKERYDVLTWVNWISGHYGKDTPVYLEGTSMGAATVLMSIGLGLPVNVAGVWADSAYTAPKAILKKFAGDYFRYPGMLMTFLLLGARLYGGFDPNAAAAADAVKAATVPIRLIHGTADGFVPAEMSRAIRDANPSFVRLTEVPGAPHVLSCMKAPDTFDKAFREFHTAGEQNKEK